MGVVPRSTNDGRRVYHCPVELTLDVIGGKWKPLLLWELRAGPRRFGALRSSLPGIAHKVLAEQLRELERAGIVVRTERAARIRHVEYALSDFGATLAPVLDEMAGWAKRHHDEVGATLVWPPATAAVSR
jgi:DNA-binding HxlR family transcriptional regulator